MSRAGKRNLAHQLRRSRSVNWWIQVREAAFAVLVLAIIFGAYFAILIAGGSR